MLAMIETFKMRLRDREAQSHYSTGVVQAYTAHRQGTRLEGIVSGIGGLSRRDNPTSIIVMSRNPFRFFMRSPEIIQLAVMLQVRFPL